MCYNVREKKSRRYKNMLIPVYDTADEYLDGEPSSEKETELGEEGAEKFFWFRMPDNSMEPLIKEGEQILFRETKKLGEVGSVSLVAIGDELLVRRLSYAKDSLWLDAENADFERISYNGVSLRRVKLQAVRV